MTARHFWVATAATVVLAAAPAGAAAHTLPGSTAYAVAKKAVAKAVRDTNAASGRVVTCNRRSRHVFLCRGKTEYRTGASRCTFDITVRYTSATRRTTKYAITNFRCF